MMAFQRALTSRLLSDQMRAGLAGGDSIDTAASLIYRVELDRRLASAPFVRFAL